MVVPPTSIISSVFHETGEYITRLTLNPLVTRALSTTTADAVNNPNALVWETRLSRKMINPINTPHNHELRNVNHTAKSGVKYVIIIGGIHTKLQLSWFVIALLP